MPLSNDQVEADIDGGYTREVVQRILAAKDEGLVSDKAFHELRMALPENIRSYLPPLSAILEERRNQNKEIKVVPIPEVNTCMPVCVVLLCLYSDRGSWVEQGWWAGWESSFKIDGCRRE